MKRVLVAIGLALVILTGVLKADWCIREGVCIAWFSTPETMPINQDSYVTLVYSMTEPITITGVITPTSTQVQINSQECTGTLVWECQVSGIGYIDFVITPTRYYTITFEAYIESHPLVRHWVVEPQRIYLPLVKR